MAWPETEFDVLVEELQVAGWSECVPDSPAGLDSKVKVESHRLHFR